jgi:hypothetical protein
MAYAHQGGASARAPSEPAKDRVLLFSKERRRASLYPRAGAELY